MNEDYIRNLIKNHKRLDNRKLDEHRPIKIEYGISSKSAEGSSRVRIGNTEVVCGVKFDVGEPFPDKPDEGTIMVNVELLPLSSPEFESGPPRVDSIELARVVDRGIRESKAIDFKKLCIKAGEKVWLVFIDIYPINDNGNLFDAASLAALAALKDTKYPKYDEKAEKIIYEERTKNPLQLEKHPLAVTVNKVNGNFLLDPTDEEENVIDSRLTIAILEDNTLSALQKGGDEALTPEDIDKMIEMAQKAAKTLRGKI
ncbi:MAG: exosome complex protein Rrp42 [Candidatus Nanoarchaeia archaeon]|nr:exosome complex protein Rrp42 [Candidatus Nanoarchaeia archaeon]